MKDIFTVSDIIHAIKTSLEFEFSEIQVEGEIFNISYSSTGHYYFTLTDGASSLSCALFKGDALRNPMVKRLKKGDVVQVIGPINVYAKKGSFQLITKRISIAGKGDLQAQYEALKRKLSAEGLFDPEHKRAIPSFPQKIAILTAPSGAAVQDFINIMRRRSLWFELLIIPCAVQGEQCLSSHLKALNYIQERNDIDLVVITRGGGSLEDLWGYNEEQLVRRIANLNTPVISAVGHQVDFTLCDFVADRRVETPSTAAELISQPQIELHERMKGCSRSLKHSFEKFRFSLSERLERVNPTNQFQMIKNKILTLVHRIHRLKFLDHHRFIPLHDHQMQLDELLEAAANAVASLQERGEKSLELNARVLESLNPNAVLQRGYSMVKVEKQIITNSKQFDKLKKQESISLVFHDGERSVKKN